MAPYSPQPMNSCLVFKSKQLYRWCRRGILLFFRNREQDRRISHRKIREILISLRGKQCSDNKTNQRTVQCSGEQFDVGISLRQALQPPEISEAAPEEH